VEELYFIIGLSQCRELVNLKGGGHGAGTLTIQEYINTYYFVGTQKMRSQVPIKNIEYSNLKIILLMIARASSSMEPHLASRPQMNYVVECLCPTMFDWCIGILTNMKAHLIDCKMGWQDKFGYGIILCTFLFEWIPLTCFCIIIPPPSMHELRILWWVDLIPRLGGRHMTNMFDDELFD